MKRIVLFLAALVLVLGGLGWGYPRVHRWLTLDLRLVEAIDTGNLTQARVLVEKGASVDVRCGLGGIYTPLMYAAWWGDLALAQALIERGAPVHARNDQGETALMLACDDSPPNPRLVAVLIEAGAEVEARDRRGRTALARMAEVPSDPPDPARIRVTELLLRAGANINTYLNGEYVLGIAEVAGSRDVARVLRAAGARGLHEQLAGHEGAELLYAVKTRDLPAVKRLLGAGHPVDVRDFDGRTPLMIAALDKRDAGLLRLLLQHPQITRRQVLEAADSHGDTALMWATRMGEVERVRLLVRAGADPHRRNLKGDTPFREATRRAGIGTLEVLREMQTAGIAN